MYCISVKKEETRHIQLSKIAQVYVTLKIIVPDLDKYLAVFKPYNILRTHLTFVIYKYTITQSFYFIIQIKYDNLYLKYMKSVA